MKNETKYHTVPKCNRKLIENGSVKMIEAITYLLQKERCI